MTAHTRRYIDKSLPKRRDSPARSLRYCLPLILWTLSLWLAIAPPAFADGTELPWAYGGAGNPTRWGRLNPDFELCDRGLEQSPVDIQSPALSRPANLTVHYHPAPVTVVNTGRTLQVNYGAGSSITLDGQTYDLVQFHFHTPSEHTLNGIAAPMELHLLHRSAAGSLAVVSVLIEVGKSHPSIDPLWRDRLAVGESFTPEAPMMNAADLLPKHHRYYSYSGSLTTPPCHEGVRWLIFTEPITLSAFQITAFEQLYPMNARPVHPLNQRQIAIHDDR
jgi:carbonic anhydrase